MGVSCSGGNRRCELWSGFTGNLMTETTQTTPLRLPLRASRSHRWKVLPIIEILVLVIGALLPLVLKDYLTSMRRGS